MNCVRPGSLSTSIRPPWRAITPCEMWSPSPVPRPGSFVVKNGSKSRSRMSGGMPEPESPIVTRTPIPSGVGSGSAATISEPRAVHRVHRVVDEVRPDLVQLGAECLDRRQVVGDLGPHVDVPQAVAQDHERLLEADADVDLSDRRLVEVGVALHGADDVADSGQRDLQLAEQLADRCIRGQPRDDVGRLLTEGRRPSSRPPPGRSRPPRSPRWFRAR